MITAHSGCEGTGIDTMESIKKALELNADAVEIDIRMDPFGVLRISHDPLSLEDYFKKNPLIDVFEIVRPTSLLINFDIKEKKALYKTLDAASEFGFPTQRLIFTGCTSPELLLSEAGLAHRAQFFLNLEELLKYVYQQRKDEFGEEIYSALLEEPDRIWIDAKTSIPNIFRPESFQIPPKLREVSHSIREKMREDIIRIFHQSGAAALNMPKILLWSGLIKTLKDNDVPLSVWTVNETEVIQRCFEQDVYNITTLTVQAVKRECSRAITMKTEQV